MDLQGYFHLVLIALSSLLVAFTVEGLLFHAQSNSISKTSQHKTFHIYVHSSLVVAELDDRFLSVALPSTIVKENKRDFNTRNHRLQTLCKALSPAFLRVGGTSADFLTFDPDAVEDGQKRKDAALARYVDSFQDNSMVQKHFDNFTMSATSWDRLNSFAMKCDWRLLFDLNVLLRRGKQWDPTNALKLLQYSIGKNFTQNLDFELGNEPDAFKHAINRTLTARQLGKDFLSLHSLLRRQLSPHYSHSLLIGPDITKPRKKSLTYLSDFLQIVDNRVDKITFHQYYCNGRNTSVNEFLDPKTLKILPQQISAIKQQLAESNSTRPLWLGETSSCFGGGAPVLSQSFVAGFLWADKLGQAAVNGIEVVIRQTLFSGHYSLISDDYYPLPDYWLSLLHKTLMGRRVLAVSGTTSHVRAYAHCTQDRRSAHLPASYSKGSITSMIINLRNHSSTIEFSDALASSRKHVFWLTAHGHNGLKSRYCELNGEKLVMLNKTTLPIFTPRLIYTAAMDIPALSFGFVVFTDVNASACH